MTAPHKKLENRYVNDLRRYGYGQSQFFSLRNVLVPIGLSIVFLALVGTFVVGSQSTYGEDWLIVAIAAVVGGYMALNIGGRRSQMARIEQNFGRNEFFNRMGRERTLINR